MIYTASAVSTLHSEEVLSQKSPDWCLPNACLHGGGALVLPNPVHHLLKLLTQAGSKKHFIYVSAAVDGEARGLQRLELERIILEQKIHIYLSQALTIDESKRVAVWWVRSLIKGADFE